MKNILMLITLAFLAPIAFSQDQFSVNKTEGMAISGFDAVSYFQGNPEPGNARFQYTYKGAIWLFSNSQNRDLFVKSPEKYEPQFGGWCAWAVGEKNAKFPVNPTTYKITDGKLYLFYNGPFDGGTFNALEPWNKDERNLLRKSEVIGKLFRCPSKIEFRCRTCCQPVLQCFFRPMNAYEIFLHSILSFS